MLSILFPRTCHICGDVLRQGVPHVCAFCMQSLPYTGQCHQPRNAADERFDAIPEVERAAGWFYYAPKSDAAKLLESIKYGGFSRLAEWLGEQMARDVAPTGFIGQPDAIIPVPLHFMRQMRRGYNQSERLARGISRVCGAPVVQPARAGRHRTQTALSADARRRNVRNVFRLKKHVVDSWRSLNRPPLLLLVDDVCTTGATLSSLAETLAAAIPGVRLRILTLAVTNR